MQKGYQDNGWEPTRMATKMGTIMMTRTGRHEASPIVGNGEELDNPK